MRLVYLMKRAEGICENTYRQFAVEVDIVRVGRAERRYHRDSRGNLSLRKKHSPLRHGRKFHSVLCAIDVRRVPDGMHAVPEYVMFPALVDFTVVPDTLEKYALGDMPVLVQSQRQEVTAGTGIEEHLAGLHEIRFYHRVAADKGLLNYPVKVRQEILLNVPVQLLVRDLELDFPCDKLRQIRGRSISHRQRLEILVGLRKRKLSLKRVPPEGSRRAHGRAYRRFCNIKVVHARSSFPFK